MRVGTLQLVVEYYDDSNHPHSVRFSGISRAAVKRYLSYYSKNYVLRSWTMLDRPDGLVSL